ncbi:MAG: peptidylprolyl isomerase [Rhodospirillales bacterium]|nr:peptidylprolyl isomerase [Rhodospirillales bacterium]
MSGPRDPENHLILDLPGGKVTIELHADLAPLHVERMKLLARDGFYDGTVFHRVMEGFMAQGGDPTGTGTGGSPHGNLKAEFSSEPFKRGTCGMARCQHPDSANSQFFICFGDARFLDGQYTLWGQVVEGMEAVDRLKKAPAHDRSGMVPEPDALISMKVLADA